MATKAQQDLLNQAIEDLHINVPIYRVHTIQATETQPAGLRIWLYGHYGPIEWRPPKPKAPRKKRATT